MGGSQSTEQETNGNTQVISPVDILYPLPLTSKQWGWRKYQLIKNQKALYLSVRFYGAAAWQPRLAATCLEQLECTENSTLRVILVSARRPQLRR